MTRLLAALRSLLSASMFVLLWWWVVVSMRPVDKQTTLVLAYEEPALQAQFGKSYSEYRLSVNRWFPRVPRDSERS